ncbi:MAG: N-acetyltransferase [Planctomycetes bacterium]|nr:N-acetyltransferase [Planctomycetota bacterium]
MNARECKPQVRKAKMADVRKIHRLINDAAGHDDMLPRSLSEIYEKLRDFHVCVANDAVVGCCALHIVWDGIAEIRSLAVDEQRRGAGIGTSLMRRCLVECQGLGVGEVFVLTYVPAYFERAGFGEVSKDVLPHKIWSDCVKCPKFPDCGEVAMMLTLGDAD